MAVSNQYIEKVKEKFPLLIYFKDVDDNSIFEGELHLNHTYNDVRMIGKFDVKIIVPREYPSALPTVEETSKQISESYTHKYTNGQLCLASNLELKMHFNKDMDISAFIDYYIIPYFYTYRYFEEYGVYPYGERSHGYMGDLEYLKDLLKIDNGEQVFDIMTFVIRHSYRGHLMCPCGSGNRLRNCHGEIIKQMVESGLGKDLEIIMEDIYRTYMKGKNG